VSSERPFVPNCTNSRNAGDNVSDIAKVIGADSLAYLSIDAASKLATNSKCGFCLGCFTGKYPIDVPSVIEKNKFEQKISENKNK
jgi:amidophosphoribosyltransferase